MTSSEVCKEDVLKTRLVLFLVLLVSFSAGCPPKSHEIVTFDECKKPVNMDICGFQFTFYRTNESITLAVSSQEPSGSIMVFIWDEKDDMKEYIFYHVQGQKIDPDTTKLPLGHVLSIDVYKQDYEHCMGRRVEFK